MYGVTSASAPIPNPINDAASTPTVSDCALASRYVPSAAIDKQTEPDARSEEPIEEPASGESSEQAGRSHGRQRERRATCRDAAIGEQRRHVCQGSVLGDRLRKQDDDQDPENAGSDALAHRDARSE